MRLDDLPMVRDVPIAPCEYSCVDVHGDAAADALRAADVAFSYSPTWARDDQNRLTELSHTFAERLRPGARVITVGATLLPRAGAGRFERVGSREGANRETGDRTQGHVWRVVR